MSSEISIATSSQFLHHESSFKQKAKEDPLLEVVDHGEFFSFCLPQTNNHCFADLDQTDLEIQLSTSTCETSLSECSSEESSSGTLEVPLKKP